MNRGLKKLLTTIGIVLLITTTYTMFRYLKSKDKYADKITLIEKALKDWGSEYHKYLPLEGETITIPLQTLKQSGHVEQNIKNPKTREKFSNKLLMTITRNKKKYIYNVLSDDENMIENYDDINMEAPMIILKGNATEYVELGHPYEEKGYVGITKSGKKADEEDITVKSEGKYVSFIDSTKLKTYQITYKLSYAKESNEITRTVVVRDTEKPTITMDRLTVKSEDVKNLDLMKGVTIEDNSKDKLSVNIIGELSSVPKKYILTYQVIDSSGNKKEKKRVIRVED